MVNSRLGLKRFAQTFQLIVLCRFMMRSYATHTVLPVSYSWSTFTGPVSGEVREVKSQAAPWTHQPSTSYVEFKGSGDGNDLDYGPDYVVTHIFFFVNILIVRISVFSWKFQKIRTVCVDLQNSKIRFAIDMQNIGTKLKKIGELCGANFTRYQPSVLLSIVHYRYSKILALL